MQRYHSSFVATNLCLHSVRGRAGSDPTPSPELGVHAAALRDEQKVIRRKDILNILHDSAWKLLVQQADCAGQERLRAISATGADAWLRMTPGLMHDSMLGNVAFRDIVGLRLGLCLSPDASTCAFCHQNLDDMGHHVLACMGQGHKQTMHHTLRNTILLSFRSSLSL